MLPLYQGNAEPSLLKEWDGITIVKAGLDLDSSGYGT